jgi:phosphatidylglycerophosphate synthase
MQGQPFAGDKKLPMNSLLAKPERRFIDANIHRFPRWIEGYHLTLMTLLWSAGVVAFGSLARRNIHWLWGSSLMLFLQWFTDSFDGSLGRHRDTGIPKWGYYMDHLLDYVFAICLAISYAFLFEGSVKYVPILLAFVYGALMTSAYLAFAATNEFKITYMGIGPTETRLLFIILNALLILFGIKWLEVTLPYVLVLSLLVSCVVVFRTQKYIWNMDMKDKKARMKAQ